MIKVCNEKVISFSLEYQEVYWEIESTLEDIQEYHFFVERSESEGGPFLPIAGPLIDRYYIRDSDFPSLTHNRQLFYRIRVVHVPSGKESLSSVFDRRGEHTLEALEIIRTEQILFREHIGARCWLFPIRTFGQRCPQCFNPYLGKAADDACTTCWGTTYAGGYHYPIEMWAQIDPHESTEQLTSQLHQQPKQKIMRTGPTPFAKPLDLLIDHKNDRYRVVTAGGTSRLGVPVQQVLRLASVDKGGVENKIPLKIDERTIQLTPSRVYVNPHTVGNNEIEFSSLLSLYGVRK